MIKEFRGKNFFLSNFSDSPIELNGIKFLNGEAAFHSFKNIDKQSDFSKLDPSTAKRKGMKVRLRNDWEDVKDKIMYEVVKAKFTQNEQLKVKLLNTGDQYLEEGNTWSDSYWGTCNGKGKNILGKILMRIREELVNNKVDENIRIIKFRGQTINGDELVYGGYHKHLKVTPNPIGYISKESDYEHLIIKDGFSDWGLNKPIEVYVVSKETVCEFTGLYDSNNNEIYENDIVSLESSTLGDTKNIKGSVKCYEGAWWIENSERTERLFQEMAVITIEN